MYLTFAVTLQYIRNGFLLSMIFDAHLGVCYNVHKKERIFPMLPGVYLATKKDGSIYYRSNITYNNKHISLGSFPSEQQAHKAYVEAGRILSHKRTPADYARAHTLLAFDKIVSLINFRDNRIYIKNPIYLKSNYFIYYLSATEELKFDIDDLFFYSSHRILKRQGHLYVNDYGMQVTLLSRYGIKSYAVCGRDYTFANGDTTDYRYSNIIVINRYTGVTAIEKNGTTRYRVQIHINGNYTVGTYSTEEKAAVAYNKAADLAREHGIMKNHTQNYVLEYSAREYAEVYTKIKISKKYLDYLEKCSSLPATNPSRL